jgi:hypothetical protein
MLADFSSTRAEVKNFNKIDYIKAMFMLPAFSFSLLFLCFLSIAFLFALATASCSMQFLFLWRPVSFMG